MVGTDAHFCRLGLILHYRRGERARQKREKSGRREIQENQEKCRMKRLNRTYKSKGLKRTNNRTVKTQEVSGGRRKRHEVELRLSSLGHNSIHQCHSRILRKTLGPGSKFFLSFFKKNIRHCLETAHTFYHNFTAVCAKVLGVSGRSVALVNTIILGS